MPGAEPKIGRLRLRLSGLDPAVARGHAERTGRALLQALARDGLSGRIDSLELRVTADEARDPSRLSAAIVRAVRERLR